MSDVLGFIKYITQNNENYRLQLHCVVTEEVHLPKHVKDKFGIGNNIVLVINSRLAHHLEIDGTDIYWDTSFNRVPYTVKVPLENIMMVGDSITETAVAKTQNPVDLISIPTTGEFQLKLVSHNQTYNKTPATGKLKLVVNNE